MKAYAANNFKWLARRRQGVPLHPMLFIFGCIGICIFCASQKAAFSYERAFARS